MTHRRWETRLNFSISTAWSLRRDLIDQEINNSQDVCTAQYKRAYSFETRVDCGQVRKVHRVTSFGGITYGYPDRLPCMP